MKLIKSLGVEYTSSKKTRKRTFGIYECPICKIHFRACTTNVTQGNSTKCASCAKAKSGVSKNPLYGVWASMQARCHNISNNAHKYYGGRGITMSEEFNDFETFVSYISNLEHFGEEGYSLDRVDVEGNYERGNLRWATRSTQSQNTRLLFSDNTSGYRGVSWNKAARRWVAYLMVSRKRIHLGYFDEKEDAARAYNAYITENGTAHPLNIIKE